MARFLPVVSSEIAWREARRASILNVATIASVTLFATTTQVLVVAGVVTLSTIQMVTIWLVAGGFIVLLSIANMACNAYVTAKSYEASAAEPQGEAELPPSPTGEPLWSISARPGPRLPVKMADVFPKGCYLVPGSISEAQDYDELLKIHSPELDKRAGKRVYQCRVVDMDPGQEGRSRETVIKIVADHEPVPPTQVPYESVEFEGLTAIPHGANRGRAVYDSLRATGIRKAIDPPKQAMDPAVENRFLPPARTNWSGKVLASARRVEGDFIVGELKVWFEPKTVHSDKKPASIADNPQSVVAAPSDVSTTGLTIQDGSEGTHAEFVISVSGGEEMSVFPRRQVARIPTDTASEEYIFRLLAGSGMKSREDGGPTTGENRAEELGAPVVEAMPRINRPILIDISMAGRTVQVIETHLK
jgi:hypothetical protein